MFFTTKEIRDKSKKSVYIPDFFIKDISLVIEFYGDYWHGNPKIYNKNDIILGVLAEDVWKNDSERLMFFKEHYKVDSIIIWESDFRTNKEKVLKKIMEIVNGRKNKITNKI
jgi:G:T-mismatch repair DNA endonuclease (very short patch repair protein)